MQKGFTLAEVLITLVIIGIIAAITIPSLMNKTNEQETVVAVKKAYSVFGQAFQRMVAENGEIYPSTLGADSIEATTNFAEKFIPYLNTQKICGIKTGEDCWATSNNGVYKFLDGSEWADWNNVATEYKFVLGDGTFVGIHSDNVYDSRGTSEALQYSFATINVDINGDKGPNVCGIDVFGFIVTKYGIVLTGLPDSTYGTISDCRQFGKYCSAWIVTKGNMDYLKKDISW